jgi:hypothetical protein
MVPRQRLNTSVLALLLVMVLPLRGQDEPAKKSSVWMKEKLQASQAILAGLASADFQAIGQNATAMDVTEYFEKWQRAAGSPGDRTQLRLFEFANRELIRAAREKNIDAATLAFNQLTVSCVNCHKIVRDAAR